MQQDETFIFLYIVVIAYSLNHIFGYRDLDQVFCHKGVCKKGEYREGVSNNI